MSTDNGIHHQGSGALGRTVTDQSTGRVAVARRIQRTRCRANMLFGSRFLSDPRYEMLLELYVAHHEGREVSVSDLALAVDIPSTTGLRKLETLEAEGLVYRLPDRQDRRRIWVKPAPEVMSKFDVLLDQLGEGLRA